MAVCYKIALILQVVVAACLFGNLARVSCNPISDQSGSKTKDKCHLKQVVTQLGRDFLNRTFSVTKNVCEVSSHVNSGTCYVKRAKVLQFPLQNGMEKLSDGRQCRYVEEDKRCRRYSKVEIFYPGTAHETFINVGMCVGSCDSGSGCSCQPVSHLHQVVSFGKNAETNKTIVDSHVIPTIKNCSCVENCYRVPQVLTYNVLVMRNGSMVAEDQEIDFGKCVAHKQCSPLNICGPWNPLIQPIIPIGCETDLTSCEIERECMALDTSTRRITLAPSGKQIEITTIESCDCQINRQLYTC